MPVRNDLSSSVLRRLILACRTQTGAIANLANPSEQGLSLIECLVAIIIITLTVVVITPPVFLATATRIQSRRAEQANQIAQAEIDRVRAIVERPSSKSYTVNELPDSIGKAAVESFGAAATVKDALLSSSSACGKTKYPQATLVATTELVPVDINGDCNAEFAMQVYRNQGCPDPAVGTAPPDSFLIGVRVYAYDPDQALPSLTTERATLSLTSGRRDQGDGSRKPLQALYSRIANSNSDKSIECVAKKID
ncbi:MAG: hypothetical protein HC866_08965 [Leptolyngbyaceae cyanobacterium RU_5_1]|nr:hypothetical protein [Leptolyngbyaceae cyanobacterium RU_5_1]